MIPLKASFDTSYFVRRYVWQLNGVMKLMLFVNMMLSMSVRRRRRQNLDISSFFRHYNARLNIVNRLYVVNGFRLWSVC